MGTSFHGGVVGKPGRGLICRGLMCVEEGSGTGLSLYRGPVGEPGEVGPSTGNIENSLKEGYGYGESLSTGALLGKPGEGGSFAGDPLGYEMKALETGISLHGDSVGQPGMGSSTSDFERWLKRSLEVQHLSLGELCEGNLEGVLPRW